MKENIVCSNSPLRRGVANYYGLPVIAANNTSNIAEEQTKEKIGDGCITPLRRDKDSPPLPLELSIDKAIAIEKNRQGPNSFTTIDSVYLVRMPNDEEFLIHKPETDEDIEKIVRLFYQASLFRTKINSFSGITAYYNGNYDTYTIELELGEINPNTDWGGLTRKIEYDNYNAAGLSTIDIINNLMEPSNPRRVKIRIYKNEARENKDCYVTGEIIGGYELEYSNDSTNNPITVALSVGIIPRRF